jgi:NADPH:quinone reductase-like Zn-dependent oxidoreductase
MGATVLATASSHNHDYLMSLGAVPIDRHGDVVRQVQAVAPDGVDAVMDVAGGPDAVATSVPVIKDGGRVASILGPPDLGEEGTNRGLKSRYVFVRPYGAQLADLAAMVDTGAIRIHLQETFPLENASEAHRAIQAGGVRGKLAVTLES